MSFVFMSPVLEELKRKNCTVKPDAVKIYITDCGSAVKRNCLPSALNGASASVSPTGIKLPDLTTATAMESRVSHRVVSFFSLLQGDRDRIAHHTPLFEGKRNRQSRRRQGWNRDINLV